MTETKALTALTLKDLFHQVKDEEEWWGEVKVQTQFLLKRLLEASMEEEILAHLQANRYQRSHTRSGYRNGYRSRSLLTEMGLLSDIRVPRCRDGAYQPSILPRYMRRQRQVDQMVRQMFLSGVSTRRVSEVIFPLLGEGVSAQTVSRITRSLDEEVGRYHRRPLGDDYLYLLLDGIVLKVKGATGVKKILLLCAYGITLQGKRELIDFRVATAESERQWEGFLRQLYERGLSGASLRLVSTDGAKGIHRALDVVYPYVPRQHCWAHKLRNVAAKLRRKNQEEALKGARRIYLAANRREAIGCFKKWADRWRGSEKGAVECLEKDLDELLSFFACSTGHWKKVRTTNAIERTFREVRRRTRPMSCFENPMSVERIVYGVISHLNKKWQEKPLPHFTHFS